MPVHSPPPRGFSTAEFEARLDRAQRLMRAGELDALLLTSEPEIRYFSGFFIELWESPTRPWFLVVPTQGKPVAVIPEIGGAAMEQSWIEDIRTWPAPAPPDDGLSLLGRTLREIAGAGGTVGLPMGHETRLGMPLAAFDALRARSENKFTDATSIIRALRLVKSAAEVAKIKHICAIVSGAYSALPALVAPEATTDEIFRAFRVELLRRGADDVPYLVGSVGWDGYGDIVSAPRAEQLQPGSILVLDTGARFDGYFCDFNRNFATGSRSDAARRAHDILYQATAAGLDAARPGATCAQLYRQMAQVLEAAGSADAAGGGGTAGRMGHGLGMQLTEWPSLAPWDETVLAPGMVITLEPYLRLGPGRMMVHEENIVIREDGAELLTRRTPAEIPLLPTNDSHSTSDRDYDAPTTY
ncbi:MAG: Xaa-Pro peptidase family protein [Candidatus Promineifilaceae bacterium]|nr:Xaa-Pro peptidase family protein [Candidatus Promineifilaceae bacterium]